jgi:hypothetical protein
MNDESGINSLDSPLHGFPLIHHSAFIISEGVVTSLRQCVASLWDTTGNEDI